ncbi:DUF3772 domain-containing protein [Blastochloris viridis]|uniref:Potassium efflux system KefA n=1 Tax=Blastochloris viridis TaxID=1079 RepID=A0A0H5BC24_BLAVI|nr:DUF3772 domain-containing protein [Blastochloris viridis]ALK08066.1 Mechanosensitive channel MscK precursor [Blastochloris viridis]BAR98674.1 potassium efflux system KefA protein [Blastochloris viridis]CUU43988.1 Potassium efflux system KefA precursor [Blastochloris viridis]
MPKPSIRLVPAVRRLFAVFALCLLPLSVPAAFAQGSLDDARTQVEKAEENLTRENLRDRDLEEIKLQLDPLRDVLQARVNELEPRVREVGVRLKELGKKPDAEAPPEDAKLTAEREELEKRVSTLDGELKQAKLLLLRSEQLADRVTERRRALFAAEVFSQTSGILNPQFWTRTIAALALEARGVAYLFSDWWAWVEAKGGESALVPPAIALGMFGVVCLLIARWWRRRRPSDVSFDAPRIAHARAAWHVFLAGAIPATAVAAVVLTVFRVSELLSPRMLDLGHSIVLAVGLAALAHGVSDAVLAPGRKARRLLDFDADRAVQLHQLVVWSSRVFAAAIVVNALHKAVVAPLSLTLATSAVMTLAITAFTAWTLWATKPEEPSDEEDAAPDGEADEDVNSRAQRLLRLFGWIVVLVCVVALAAGYVGFAAFFIGRLVIATVLIGIVYLAFAMIDATVSEGMMATTVRGRRAAGMVGVSPATLEVIATIVSGLVKVVLFTFAAVVAVGPWGVHVVDITSTFSEVFFGVELNTIVVPVTAVAGAIALLFGVLVATRLTQGWLERNLLPRTRIEPSLQHSVKQIIGYIGIIVAVILALGQIGIDLQNIALVAGALSVGIGFGLQSIVSNFVSGLILLTERPIRVGDTIAVKGEEGYVRRISVRATEIETFERSSVIIPNTDLITGVVKNWTHGSPTGRIIIAVNIPYDTDPDEVRDILIAAACEHPQVLKSPPPRVFLLKFGDTALQFELRCIVSNVDYSLTVRSDLHFAILYRLRKAGIVQPVVPPLPELVRRPAEASPETLTS